MILRRISRTQSFRRTEAGFTLVELMVVLAVLGMMVAVVVVTLPGSSSLLEEDAQRFAARTAALRDNAILQSRPMAVQVTPSGYSFLERRKGSWMVLEDKPFMSTDWSDGVNAVIDENGSLLISFESTGLASDQARVMLRYQDNERVIDIAPMGDVKLAVLVSKQ